MISADTLAATVARIVEEVKPSRVILFGSQARQTAQANSDVDLLVIGHFDEPNAKVFMRINRSLSGLDIDRDIVLMTPEAFETTRHIMGTIAYPASREGVVLYHAPQ
jgi:uncharacterized protein